MPRLRVLPIARRLARQLPEPARESLRRGYRRLRPGKQSTAPAPAPSVTKPTLTIVIAAREAEQHIAQCLQSLLRQTLNRLEVIVVDDGSTDHTAAEVEQVAATDDRVQLVRRPRAGLGAARNHGASLATGKYLAFVNPDDTVPRTAFALMIKTLSRTGSDFVIGSVQRRRLGRTSYPPWIHAVHGQDREGTTVDEFPAVMQDVVAFNRVFRRSFWMRQVGGFEDDNENADALAMTTALIRASRFDVLRTVTYHCHDRPSSRSLAAKRSDYAQLDAHLRMLESTWEIMRSEAAPEVAGGWLTWVLSIQLGNYIQQAGSSDDAFRARLAAAVRTFLAATNAEVWRAVPLERRVRVWLAADERWRDVEQVLEFFRLNGAIPPTRVDQGRVYAVLPFLDGLGGVPEDCLELGPAQSHLSGCVERAIWLADGTLAVDGWAFIRGVDMSSGPVSLSATLLDSHSHLAVPVTLERQAKTAANRWSKQLNQDFSHGGFRILIDVDALPASARRVRRWLVVVEVEAHGVTRSGVLRSQLTGSVAQRMSARPLTGPDDPDRFVPMLDPALGFLVHQRPDLLRARHLEAEEGHLEGVVRALVPLKSGLELVRLRCETAEDSRGNGGQVADPGVGAAVVEAPLTPVADDRWRFRVDLPTGGTRLDWSVRAVDGAGREHRISWPVEAEAGTSIGAGPGRAAWHRSSRGYCDVSTDLRFVDVFDVKLGDDRLRFDIRTLGVTSAELEGTVLRSPLVSVPMGSMRETQSNVYELEFPLQISRWGQPALPLPSSSYRLQVPALNLFAAADVELLERFPLEGVTKWHGFRINRRPGKLDLTVHLSAPLADEERGRFAEGQLAAEYAQTDYRPRHAVLFQCYRGEFATDSQRAIHEELHRRGTDLELLWGVADYSVELPAGAVPLIIGSRKWYEAVGASRYLCQNIDFDRFFRHRPHQRYLQTFHGYPFKSMGISLWTAQGRSPWSIEQECLRRQAAWDAILVPSQECIELYRREYRYDGQFLVTGYPRDDSLVQSDPDAVRKRVLSVLGIDPDKTVVLYAPTWRDTAATSAWTAKIFDQLDLNMLASGLGENYALLMRGHNYNLREQSDTSTASVLDVSSYPEINDLILAADVAVLDYSSLRFDWLITEKPLLFFVPDLEDYLSARRALFDFGSTAPGPLLFTTAEILAALRDIDRVRSDYAADRKSVNEAFNGLHDGRAAARVVDAFFG